MRGWLVDANVVSELQRARPNQKVRAFVAGQIGDVLFTSDVTFAEVCFGIEQMGDAARRSDLVHWLDRTLRPLFSGRVLPVTEDALLRLRLMLEAGRTKGRTFSEPDLLIAALAVQANLIVASRDTSAFVAAGVPVFDPWNWSLHVGDRVLPVVYADGPGALAEATALIAN